MATSEEDNTGSPQIQDGASSAATDTAKTPGSFQILRDPVVEGEPVEDAHKFEVSPEPAPVPPAAQPEYENLGQLPSTYNEETLFLVARDPRWLFSYWDFNWWSYPAAEMRHGMSQFYLRVSKAGGEDEQLIEIRPEARNWYIHVPDPDSAYRAEIGFYDRYGAWRSIVQSEIAHTPPDALAPEAEAAFATVPAHITFDKLLNLVQERMVEGESLIAALSRIAGEGRVQFNGRSAPTWTDQQKRLLAAILGNTAVDRLGLGSDEIDQLLRKQLQERLHSESASGLALSLLEVGPESQSLFSAFGGSSGGLGASWSAQPFSLRAERGFFMHVNAEIIFYGGTHSDATVTVNGEKVQLTPDGMFRYHFTLPDGDFEIPVVATSPDGLEQRSATLSFRRDTTRQGEVGSTDQPQELDLLIGKV
ncbi:MAG: DUF4912 domain-containing protein [Chthoniobacteraceae bacterium]